MNKSELKKSVGRRVKLRPLPKRFVGGPGGLQLPPTDDVWIISRSQEDGIWIDNTATHHGTLLRFDQIYEYLSDTQQSQQQCGFLTLKAQLSIGGDRLWIEPTFRPGEALPDRFGGVREWKRENDGAYIQTFATKPTPTPLPYGTYNPAGLGMLLGICLGVGLGLLIANA